MKVKIAEASDAPLIYDLMIKAFMEYKDEVPPSSALEETVQTISTALEDGEQALISYIGDEPVGMVRFRLTDNGVYFYRLSVIPEKQGQGIAKGILKSLDDYAKQNEKTKMLCKVRMTVPKNIKLYSSIGYRIHDEEIVHKPNGINIKVVSMEKKLL
ncbi:GNAT family N-acetyltransferase [Sporosarcina sp. G11-34]|uniref:GNAT family N-acetyltransferase n=1 Tax=Sporosarcina sp. G11-34 TaxID=2849605 RepID=UPI0022A988A7|nr:GNAT family N-acetyltransferase [Sporosarcina sp. G11-34]MCZ2258450.1 GNAT family N-acetyltransferase [Sporosarcina sp. G11-34]